jgi:tRNA U54 and U55 pseudouridine synthase Pus10
VQKKSKSKNQNYIKAYHIQTAEKIKKKFERREWGKYLKS